MNIGNYFFFSLLLLILSASCKEDEPEKNCYDCERIIQTYDSERRLILRQEDTYTLCERTKEEILEYELENSYEEPRENGGSRERFTSCWLQGAKP